MKQKTQDVFLTSCSVSRYFFQAAYTPKTSTNSLYEAWKEKNNLGKQ